MTIAWQFFTPWSSLAGGALIGLAAAVLVLFQGRIAGISGIMGGLFTPQRGDVAWRVLFLAGMLLAAVLARLITDLPLPQVDVGWPMVIAAGLLVGVGTRLGAGCTSGHGVCGLSRLSLRSLVATGLFMAAGFVTVWLVRHVLGA